AEVTKIIRHVRQHAAELLLKEKSLPLVAFLRESADSRSGQFGQSVTLLHQLQHAVDARWCRSFREPAHAVAIDVLIRELKCAEVAKIQLGTLYIRQILRRIFAAQ